MSGAQQVALLSIPMNSDVIETLMNSGWSGVGITPDNKLLLMLYDKGRPDFTGKMFMLDENGRGTSAEDLTNSATLGTASQFEKSL